MFSHILKRSQRLLSSFSKTMCASKNLIKKLEIELQAFVKNIWLATKTEDFVNVCTYYRALFQLHFGLQKEFCCILPKIVKYLCKTFSESVQSLEKHISALKILFMPQTVSIQSSILLNSIKLK